MDGEITLKGNQLLASNLAVNEIDLALLMEGGLLRFTPRSLVVGGGRISGTGELDARGERATLNIKLDGEGLGLGKMLAETGVNDLITDAVTRMQIRLKGSGGSVAALLGSLSGRVLVDVGRGKVNNEHLNLSGADLVSELLVALNPFAKKELLAAE
ncbi:MAG: AsmA-like C-terminal region-containing protein [Candidatus Sedimenticola endophacoides]